MGLPQIVLTVPFTFRNFDVRPVYSRLAQRFAATQPLQQFHAVLKLGHVARIAEVGQLDALDPGQNQLLGVIQLGVGGNKFFLMLQAVTNRDIADCDFFRIGKIKFHMRFILSVCVLT